MSKRAKYRDRLECIPEEDRELLRQENAERTKRAYQHGPNGLRPKTGHLGNHTLRQASIPNRLWNALPDRLRSFPIRKLHSMGMRIYSFELACLQCGAVWEPGFSTDGKLKQGYRKCPGCKSVATNYSLEIQCAKCSNVCYVLNGHPEMNGYLPWGDEYEFPLRGTELDAVGVACAHCHGDRPPAYARPRQEGSHRKRVLK